MLCTRLCLILTPATAALAAAAGAGEVNYNRDVRPVLAENCFGCHGPDAHGRKASLRLDLAEEAARPAKSGAVAVVPGKPDASELVKRIFASDPDDRMPPEETHKHL